MDSYSYQSLCHSSFFKCFCSDALGYCNQAVGLTPSVLSYQYCPNSFIIKENYLGLRGIYVRPNNDQSISHTINNYISVHRYEVCWHFWLTTWLQSLITKLYFNTNNRITHTGVQILVNVRSQLLWNSLDASHYPNHRCFAIQIFWWMPRDNPSFTSPTPFLYVIVIGNTCNWMAILKTILLMSMGGITLAVSPPHPFCQCATISLCHLYIQRYVPPKHCDRQYIQHTGNCSHSKLIFIQLIAL